MCLLNISEKKIATEDIVCFKILRSNNLYPNEKFSALFYPNFKYELNKTYFSDIHVNVIESYMYITKSFHSFASLCDAVAHMNWLQDNSNLNLKVCEFIIPKGAIYYEGEYNSKPSYASDTIILIDINSDSIESN